MTVQFAFTPFRMKKRQAAFYCGMSEASFDRAVEANEFPKGRKHTGGTYWLRAELEQAMLPETAESGRFGQKI